MTPHALSTINRIHKSARRPQRLLQARNICAHHKRTEAQTEMLLHGQPSVDFLCSDHIEAHRTALCDVPLWPLSPVTSQYAYGRKGGIFSSFHEQPLPAARPGVQQHHCLPDPQYKVLPKVPHPVEPRRPVARRGAPARVLHAPASWVGGRSVVSSVTTAEGGPLIAE